MKVLVCGGRDFDDAELVDEVLNRINLDTPITWMVDGAARGADSLAYGWASARRIPTTRFFADWDRFGKSAGYRRNEEMAKWGPDLVVAFPGGRGTQHMIDIAQRYNIRVYIVR
jgi:hypothetical protein